MSDAYFFFHCVKVRVTRLCERCGTTPPTFYYYFRDKYELVVWIFLQDVDESFAGVTPDSGKNGLGRIIVQVKKQKTFYQKAFADQSQNSLGEYIQSFIIRYFTQAVAHNTGEAPTYAQLTVIKYHTYGIMGMFREWLFGLNMSLEDNFPLLFDQAPIFLQNAFAAYPFCSEGILWLLDHPGKDA